jgi:hypothetical protein
MDIEFLKTYNYDYEVFGSNMIKWMNEWMLHT